MTWRRRSVLGAGALAAAGRRADAARAPQRTAAIATICLDGFADLDFGPAFAQIPSLGIRNVEFNVWHPRNVSAAGIDSIKRRSAAAGLRPISLQANGFVAGEGGERTREVSRFMWLIEACRRLGCHLIKATAEERGTRGGLDGIIAVLRELAPAAERSGVRIALENHLNNNLERPEDFERVFAAIDSRSVGMCLDMAHFVASGVDVVGVVERFHDRVIHVDVKDCDGPGRHRVTPYGQGKVPIDAVLDALVARDYSGFLVLEYARAEGGIPLDELRAGADLVRRYVR